MITGAVAQSVPYIPEDERTVTEKQSVVWIKPKTGHEANEALALYAGAGRDGRQGYRELNVRKLDTADVEQFLKVVEKWEWYQFSDRFPDLAAQGPMEVIIDEATLAKLAVDLSSDMLIEVFEASSNMARLLGGAKKDSASQSTSLSGSQLTRDANSNTTATLA